MARAVRIEFEAQSITSPPEAIAERIFASDVDCVRFLELLGELVPPVRRLV